MYCTQVLFARSGCAIHFCQVLSGDRVRDPGATNARDLQIRDPVWNAWQECAPFLQESFLIVMASNLLAELLAMASNLIAMASLSSRTLPYISLCFFVS